jgi:catechol 2,3-dioxygenase-like lactoylglutathione lyase family enzyme
MAGNSEGKIQGIGQIHISVDDLQRAVEFYKDILGLELLFEVPGQSMAFFNCGGVRLYLGEPEAEEFRSNPLLYYRVDSVEKAHEALVDRGVEFSSPPHVVHKTDAIELWMAGFSDPEGNRLVLMGETPVEA